MLSPWKSNMRCITFKLLVWQLSAIVYRVLYIFTILHSIWGARQCRKYHHMDLFCIRDSVTQLGDAKFKFCLSYTTVALSARFLNSLSWDHFWNPFVAASVAFAGEQHRHHRTVHFKQPPTTKDLHWRVVSLHRPGTNFTMHVSSLARTAKYM